MKFTHKITLYLLTVLVSMACKKEGPNLMDQEQKLQQIRDRLCVSDVKPVAILNFSDETGTVEDMGFKNKKEFFIRLDNYPSMPLLSCQLDEGLKADGQRIKLSGIGYKLECIKSFPGDCIAVSSDVGIPVDIQSITTL